jgi:drug/metabolite transporter (DMT)-like permease
MPRDTRRPSDPDRMPTLFSAIMANLGPGRTAEARRHNLEVALGFLGFFSIIAVLQLVAAELRGQAAVGFALLAAVLLGLTYLVYRRWRRAGGWSTQGPRR